jgi:two-component system, chemotaxis family, chemotaxis protein CheY
MNRTQWADIVHSLRRIEELACEIYQSLSLHFPKDPDFAAFLNRMAEDEVQHCALLDGVENRVLHSSGPLPSLEIVLDDNTRERIEAPLRECLAHVQRGKITKSQALDYMVRAEFSEWNAIFLYVVSGFQDVCRSIQEIAALVQAHRARVEKFVDDLPAEERPATGVHGLPQIWKHQFLVVDDDERVRDLLAEVLGFGGQVVTAQNGAEGLEKLKSAFFDVVVSDIEMPVMDGLTFYQRAVSLDPTIVGRFLFCSGSASPQVKELCREKGMPFLDKPVPLDLLKRTVQRILDQLR